MREAVDYNVILQRAYQVSMHYVKEHDMANDIAQATSIKYYLNEEKINKDKAESWIFTVSKNLSFNYLKQCKRELNYSKNYFESKLQFTEDKNRITIDIDEIYMINAKDRQLLKQYYAVSGNLSLLAKQTSTKKEILRQKLYRIKQEVKLFELIKDGTVCTRSIPGTKLHRKIKNFLDNLKTCLKENEIQRMKQYFSQCKINKDVTSIDIKEIAQFDIDILDHNRYLLNIGYKDAADKVKFFRLRFHVTDGGHIEVIEFPIVPKKVLAFNAKEIPIDVLRKMQPNKKGVIPLTQKEFDKLIESQKDKIEVLADRE